MPPRGYVLIFFGWALLAVITPTLIFWSDAVNQKARALEVNVSRRMMVSNREIGQIQNRTRRSTTTQAPLSSPSPAPAPATMTVNQTINLQKI